MEASARINPSFPAAQDSDKCCLLFLQAPHQDSWQGLGHDISLAFQRHSLHKCFKITALCWVAIAWE